MPDIRGFQKVNEIVTYHHFLFQKAGAIVNEENSARHILKLSKIMSGDKLGHQCTEVCHCVILGKKKKEESLEILQRSCMKFSISLNSGKAN